jgi:hypothetical protein
MGGNVAVQNSTFVSHATQGGAPGGNSLVIISHQGGGGLGGAIWTSNTTANFYNSTFTSNLAVGAGLPYQGADGAGSGEGGAIFATNGVLNCVGCTFTTNSVAAGYKVKNGNVGLAQGGAIWSQASLSVSQSSFFGNQAIGQGTGNIGTGNDNAGEGSGGAIFNGNTLSLSGSTFAKNAAQGGDGGTRSGMWNCPGGIGRGGAVCSLGTLAATNCTFVANSATGGAAGHILSAGAASGGDGAGGGLFNTNGTATLVNLTFASNNAIGGAGGAGGLAGSSSGGAICNSNGTVNLYNTILANSTSGSNCWGTMFDYGHNLSSDVSAGFYAAGSLNNTDPKLGPLDDYGGPTLTVPLLTGSPAIDGGNTATAPATDQRGRSRPYGATADIGAFESSPPFVIRGIVSGSTLLEEVTVNAGSSAVLTTNHGSYSLEGLSANTYTIAPASPNYLFILLSRSITVGPDQLGVNFKAYHWGMLSLDGVTNGMLHLVFPGTNGQTYRMLTSTDLVQWLAASTNTISPSNYFEVFLPTTNGPARYYRTAYP